MNRNTNIVEYFVDLEREEHRETSLFAVYVYLVRVKKKLARAGRVVGRCGILSAPFVLRCASLIRGGGIVFLFKSRVAFFHPLN